MPFTARRFRPRESVELTERTEVEFEPKVIGEKEPPTGSMDEIYKILYKLIYCGTAR